MKIITEEEILYNKAKDIVLRDKKTSILHITEYPDTSAV